MKNLNFTVQDNTSDSENKVLTSEKGGFYMKDVATIIKSKIDACLKYSHAYGKKWRETGNDVDFEIYCAYKDKAMTLLSLLYIDLDMIGYEECNQIFDKIWS